MSNESSQVKQSSTYEEPEVPIDLSDYKAWLPNIDGDAQAIVFFKILSIDGAQATGIPESEIKQDLSSWLPNRCSGMCDFNDDNQELYSYATNALNKEYKDIVFIYQIADGLWNNQLVSIMQKLKLVLIVDGDTYKLEDDNPEGDLVGDWKITRWVVQHNVEINPLNDGKKLFCDDVTWVKKFNGVDVIVVTRHGWREYSSLR